MSYLYILDISPYQVHDLQLFSPIQAREGGGFLLPLGMNNLLRN